MNRYIVKTVTVLSCAVLAAVFILVMHFAAPKIAIAPETTGNIRVDGENYEVGKEVTAVRIDDLVKLNRISKVNYVADEFVSPVSLSRDMQIVDLTKPFEFAEKGTLIFVIMNLDPESPDFIEKVEKLDEYRVGENWHFTLSLPRIYCASNIYNQFNLVARHGEIENYEFITYTDTYNLTTEKYKEEVARTEVELTFYTKRQALNPYNIITIHYQSAGTFYSGISDNVLIGEEDTVLNTFINSQNLLITVAVLTAVAFVVLIILSLLKRTKQFIAPIVGIFGIFLMLFPKFVLEQSASFPLVCLAFSWSAVFMTLGGALYEQAKNFGKVPTKYLFVALMIAGGILAFICPFIPFKAAIAIRLVYTILRFVGAFSLLFFAGFSTFYKEDKHGAVGTATAAVIGVAVISSVFLPTVFPVHYNSMFWLCLLTVASTFFAIFKVFADTERVNAHLTANLHLEVERQLKDLRAVVTERDNLLQFVSHDMKKPLQSSEALLDTVIAREKDNEQTKTLHIIKQNNTRVISNLSEIGAYARFNYIAEPSQIADLKEILESVYEFHQPDCNANGIVLKNNVTAHYKVYVKRQGLENAITNIILNSIEHADCSTITISAKSYKHGVVLSIADDGKGIDASLNIFGAYVSEKNETNGLGLYICKNIIESMNGELSYRSKTGETVFDISLLKA